MSYVRLDDQYEGGQVSQFRERLAAEVRMQTGEEFLIFQDRNDIAWGQNWKTRIDETLDVVTLLIPIITPSFFRSPPCREETTRFLQRERRLGRDDLILPVYYISSPEMDDPERRDADELAKVLASRQYIDWREMRFEPFTAPVVRRALAQFASRMRDTFWQQPALPLVRPSATQHTRTHEAPPEGTKAGGGQPKPIGKTEPPTHVVDAYGRGQFVTIGAAIRAAAPGDRIRVRPGLYQEGLVLKKPLELLGDGPPGDIEIQAGDKNTISFEANIGRIANLTLRQVGNKLEVWAVDITQGRLELEGCDISCKSGSGVMIRNGADPRIRRNRIHDNGQVGVDIYKNGLGTLEDNDITGNVYSGVEISDGSDPTLRRNQIHNNTQAGVFVHDSGLGTLEDNDITGNGEVGVEIRSNGNPTLRHNRINHNSDQAIWVHEGGRGVIEDNDLTGNTGGAWDIAKDSAPNVQRRGNRE